MQTIVAIKGVDDKLEVYFNEMASYPSLREDLIQKLQSNKNIFFKQQCQSSDQRTHLVFCTTARD